MRRIRVTAAIAASLMVCAGPASADELENSVRVPTPLVIEVPRVQVPRQPPHVPPYVRPLIYGLQAIDAVATAAALRRAHRYEANPMMGPFSHGGVPTLALGFALGDVLRAQIFRHSDRAAVAGDGAQALSNLDGIRTTLRSLHAP